MHFLHVVALIFSLHRGTAAVPWLEPLPTPQAYLLQAGVSPRPTEVPGLNGIPKELVGRQQDVIYPPPAGWCGFINGDYSDPLTCRSTYTCVNSGYGVGCCPDSSPCTNIFTTCKDFGDVCDAVCAGNDKVLQCSDSLTPYCGTYRFSGATRLYNCDTTSARALTVQFLADHYITAIGSTLAPSRDLFSFTKESATAFSTRAAYTPSYTYSSDTSSSDSGGGLSAGAIRGIAVGISVGACVIFILLAIFIVKRRRANRMKRAAQPSLPPAYSPSAPMQQQHPPPSNPAYQPVPQQDQPYSASHGGYFTPDAVGKDNGTSVTTQPSLSPPASQTPQQRHSAAPSSFLSPNPSDQGRDSFYRPNGPVSPITEVDGSGRPMPEADSIERPTSTHQGMVGPMVTGSPPPSNSTPQYGQQPQHNHGQVHNGYVPPRAGTHEAPPSQAYSGPYEMPDQRH